MTDQEAVNKVSEFLRTDSHHRNIIAILAFAGTGDCEEFNDLCDAALGERVECKGCGDMLYPGLSCDCEAAL